MAERLILNVPRVGNVTNYQTTNRANVAHYIGRTKQMENKMNPKESTAQEAREAFKRHCKELSMPSPSRGRREGYLAGYADALTAAEPAASEPKQASIADVERYFERRAEPADGASEQKPKSRWQCGRCFQVVNHLPVTLPKHHRTCEYRNGGDPKPQADAKAELVQKQPLEWLETDLERFRFEYSMGDLSEKDFGIIEAWADYIRSTNYEEL